MPMTHSMPDDERGRPQTTHRSKITAVAMDRMITKARPVKNHLLGECGGYIRNGDGGEVLKGADRGREVQLLRSIPHQCVPVVYKSAGVASAIFSFLGGFPPDTYT